MSLFQKMLLGKYTRPWREEEHHNSMHSHQIEASVAHNPGNISGFGEYLAQRLPAQALREFGSVTYEPPSILSSDAAYLLHSELVKEAESAESSEPAEGEQLSAGQELSHEMPRRYRSEQDQWNLETRIERLKSARRGA